MFGSLKYLFLVAVNVVDFVVLVGYTEMQITKKKHLWVQKFSV